MLYLIKKLIYNYKKSKKYKKTASNYYNDILKISRQKYFFQQMQIEDKVQNRLILLILHMCLANLQINKMVDGKIISQHLFDIFLSDMDANLRELGVGDLIVPKKMKQIAGMFYKCLEETKITITKKNNDSFIKYWNSTLNNTNNPAFNKYFNQCFGIMIKKNNTNKLTFPTFPKI